MIDPPPGDLLSLLAQWTRAMGYNARNDEIRDNVTRMQREWEAWHGRPRIIALS